MAVAKMERVVRVVNETRMSQACNRAWCEIGGGEIVKLERKWSEERHPEPPTQESYIPEPPSLQRVSITRLVADRGGGRRTRDTPLKKNARAGKALLMLGRL